MMICQVFVGGVHAMDSDVQGVDLEAASSVYMTWLDNMYVIAKTNSQKLCKLGLNQFSDMSGEQFRHYVRGPRFRRQLQRTGPHLARGRTI